MMPESALLVAMLSDGDAHDAVEAVADFLVSIGYHDAAKELRARADDEPCGELHHV